VVLLLLVVSHMPLFLAWGDDRLGEGYTIGPGDVLRVDVWGEKELSGEYRVSTSGRVNLPQVGAVDVGGLTVSAAQEKIVAALSDLIRHPRVVVTINELQSERKVYVGGAVQTPGPFILPFGATVLDAVIAAGIRPDSDLSQVALTRPGAEPITLDLSGWKTAERLEQAVLLRYGDIVFIPEHRERITVVGAVAKPVSLPPVTGERITLLELIGTAAGGLAPDADPATSIILHKDGRATRVDLHKLLEEGDMSQNVQLQGGDVVVVRKAKHISVVGHVSNPVVFASGEPVPVLAALARAGQVLPGADLSKVKIVTSEGSREVNLKAFIETGHLDEDLKLQPGDVLVVPEGEPEEVLLAGAVNRPGSIDISKLKKRDLLRIVTTVGIAPEGDMTRVCVLRGDEQIVVNYRAMLEDAQLDRNIELQPGDVLFVPPLDKIYVIGAVGGGGRAIACPDKGIALLDALVTAGGFNTEADPNQVHVVRMRPDGTSEHMQVKMGDISKGRTPADIVLRPGDIVYVGARGRKFSWQDVTSVLWTIGAVKALLD
jgi:protein involved in polysaccharide export with SLBB domain